jgi:hypothetical protein
MRIAQLLEFTAEDFRQMSQQADNIQQGNGPISAATARQQRISQLAANQQARNAAPPGKPKTSTQTAPTVTQTAPAANTPVNLTATPQDTGTTPTATQSNVPATQQQQNAPMDPTLAQHLPGQPAPKKSFAQTVGGLAKGVGAVAGGVAGIGRAIKKGYNAGADAVGGPGYAQPGAAGGGLGGGAGGNAGGSSGGGAGGNAGGSSGGGAGGNAGGSSGGGAGGNYDDEIANLKSTIQQMDQRLRRVGAE